MRTFDPEHDYPMPGARADFEGVTYVFDTRHLPGWWATDRSLFAHTFSPAGLHLARTWASTTPTPPTTAPREDASDE